MSASCEFDSRSEVDIYTWKGYSDCYKECLSTGCPKSKIGDGVCDPECNSNECAWDWGDCGYCSSGCMKSMLDNRSCDEICNNEICGYDAGACIGLCAIGCPESNIGNGFCDQLCYTEACNYDKMRNSTDPNDLGDCKICDSSVRNDGKCDSLCNSSTYSYDSGDCLCSKECWPNMLGDKICNYECLSPKCQYNEVELCTECAPGCPLQPETCIPECLTINCSFTAGDFCSPVHKTYALLSQLKARDYKKVFDVQKDCLDKHPECTLGNLYDKNCQDECNNSDCLYDMYNCDAISGGKYCKIAHKSNYNECFKCQNYISNTSGRAALVLLRTLYTTCVGICPIGFYTKRYDGYYLCLLDDSKYNIPVILYVTVEEGEDYYTDGTLDNPYLSISNALSNIRRKEVRVYLMKGEHNLMEITNSDTMKTLIGEKSPLNYFGELNPMRIEIKPMFCSIVNHPYCVPDGEKVVIRLSKYVVLDAVNTLIISDIIFIGSIDLTLGKCGSICGDKMYYCANIYYNTRDGKYYDDRNQELVSSDIPKAKDCEVYNDRYFIDVHPTGNLILRNSEFRDFRQEFKAIIYSQGGNITLYDVSFTNIRVASSENSAVIYGMDCISSYNCGTFEYHNGSVSLLNNGYEYSDSMKFSGFLAMKRMTKVTIENVEFDKNIVYIGKLLYEESKKALGVLMYFEDFREVILKDLKFRNNYIQDGLISFVTSQELIHELDDQMNLKDFYHNHIHLENIEFGYNGAANVLGIKIEMSFELLNIFMKNLNFYHNFSRSSSFISICQLNSTFKDIWINGGSQTISVCDENSAVYFPKRSLILDTISIIKSQSAASILRLKSLANIEISNLKLLYTEITQNFQGFDQEVLSGLINDNSTYIRYDIASDFPASTKEAFIYIAYSYKLSFDNGDFSYNSGATLFKIDKAMISTTLQNTRLEKNSRNPNEVLGIDINYCSSTLFKNLTCIDNFNEGESGHGVLRASSIGDYMIVISDSKFINNSATTAGAITYDTVYFASLINCEFQENSISSNKGGAVVLILSEKYEAFGFKVQSCKFDGNSAEKGAGGAIVIDNTKRSYSSLLLSISDSVFLNGFSELEASSIYISDKVSLNKDSLIFNSTFSNNVSNNKGTLYLAYFQGNLAISNCHFESNFNLIGMSIYFINKSEKQDEKSVLSIRSTHFSNHIGNSIIYMEGIRQNAELYSDSCIFINNNSNLVNALHAYWQDSYSRFSNNTSSHGAVGVLYNSAKAFLKGSVLEMNTAYNDGGAMYVFFNSEFECDSCIMKNNYSKMNGGVIYAQLNSIILLRNCTISENIAEEHGSVAFVLDSKMISSITSSTLFNNNAVKGGTVFLLKSYMKLDNTTISENISKEATGGIMMILSHINAQNCIFLNQTARDGVYFHMTTSSFLYLQNSTLSRGVSSNFGGAIYSLSSTISIEESILSNNQATSGGDIYAFTSSSIYIFLSQISNSSATISGGVIKSIESQVSIYNSEVSEYFNGAIDGENLESLTVQNNKFQIGSSVYGGSIGCNRCLSVSIVNNSFYNMNATYGGAVYLSSARLEDKNPLFNITHNIFVRNQASNGGALYLKDVHAILNQNTFEWNVAHVKELSFSSSIEVGIGAGVALSCPSYEYCEYIVKDNHFSDNLATTNGGGISWKDVMPYLWNNSFTRNQAMYGDDISSYPIKFIIRDSSGQVHGWRFTKNMEVNYIPLITSFSDIASGQDNQILNFTIELIDHYENVVKTDYLSLIEILALDSSHTTLTGETKGITKAGVFRFNDFQVSAIPGTNSSLIIQVSSINPAKSTKARDGEQYISKGLILLNLRECIFGESLVGRDCVVCKSGEYSLDPQHECKTCKDSAICYGNFTIVPKEGFWRSSKYTDKFFECFNLEACIGSEAPPKSISLTGECAKGYRGNLCQSCEIGYSRASMNMCSKCPDYESNIIKIIGIMMIICIFSSMLVYTTMLSATKPKSLKSIYIKILLNHFQLVSISSSFNLDWPNLVYNYLHAQESIGIITDQILSIDCLLSSESYDIYIRDIYYTKLIMIISLPIVIITTCLIIWGIISCYKYTTRYLKHELVASIIILLFLAHPSIIKTMFSAFNCMEIDSGEYWLVHNLDIRCWDDQHSFFALIVALPGILIWGLGIPTVCLIFLYRNKKKLEEINVRLKFAFLFNGYKPKYFYWEFVILYRKMILITCAVFLGNTSIAIQALTVMILLIISLYMQYTKAPYVYEKLNTLELRSIMVVSTTIYSGLYFLTNDLGYETKAFLFVVILLSNAYFLYYWMWHMIIETKIYEVIPYLKEKFSRSVKDTYNSELFVSKLKRETTNLTTLVSETNIVLLEDISIVPEKFYSKSYEMKDLYMESVKYKIGKITKTSSQKYEIPEIRVSEPL